jgi:hypothetical protein
MDFIQQSADCEADSVSSGYAISLSSMEPYPTLLSSRELTALPSPDPGESSSLYTALYFLKSVLILFLLF